MSVFEMVCFVRSLCDKSFSRKDHMNRQNNSVKEHERTLNFQS